MKMINRMLALLLALLLPMTFAMAESETIIASVNGEAITYSVYYAVESAYVSQFAQAGVNVNDPTIYSYIQDMALSYLIQQRLMVQDMTAQGCFDFTEEEEAWCIEQGHLAWEQALAEVGEVLRVNLELEEGTDMTSAALSYAATLGVSEQNYVDEFRMQLATVAYYEWLLGGEGVTELDVITAYTERVEKSRALYANDVAAFETAMSNGEEVWYMPEGYRAVLQILLPVEGATDEERLLNAQPTVDEIYALLEGGESFANLVILYGADANFSDPSFFNTGYSVHRDSVVWEDAFIDAAFSAQMTAPGYWSRPFASDLGVHILYYLADVPGGEVPLTEEVYDALAYVIYSERTQTALMERIEVLSDASFVIIY